MNPLELKGALEAIIYAADEPATLEQLVSATGVEKEQVRLALEEMIAACAADERGIEIRRVARGYKYSTKPQHHEAVRKFIKSLRPPVRLSMAALETLAVIAYKQPITLPEMQEIRGVNCSGVIQTLLDKRLVTTAGRKAVMGRPILYRTTKDFLVRFGLNDVDELPSLKEFEQMAREALGPEEGIEIVAEENEGEIGAETSEGATEAAEETDDETAGTELGAAGPAMAAEEEAAPGENGEDGENAENGAAKAGDAAEDAAEASEPEATDEKSEQGEAGGTEEGNRLS
jgi:segregation and condensation protein B